MIVEPLRCPGETTRHSRPAWRRGGHLASLGARSRKRPGDRVLNSTSPDTAPFDAAFRWPRMREDGFPGHTDLAASLPVHHGPPEASQEVLVEKQILLQRVTVLKCLHCAGGSGIEVIARHAPTPFGNSGYKQKCHR